MRAAVDGRLRRVEVMRDWGWVLKGKIFAISSISIQSRSIELNLCYYPRLQ
ncbi:hypothetical protein CKA32_003197 [Geitlerinema sp. FC II]|nr:hypothetical protein CKA32_003197 [Geitlerinema sp. FC II]